MAMAFYFPHNVLISLVLLYVLFQLGGHINVVQLLGVQLVAQDQRSGGYVIFFSMLLRVFLYVHLPCIYQSTYLSFMYLCMYVSRGLIACARTKLDFSARLPFFLLVYLSRSVFLIYDLSVCLNCYSAQKDC